MLSIALTAVAGFLYYAALSAGEYYRTGGRVGEWFGGLATWLGLVGQVTEQAFSNLFRGSSPDGARALVQNANSKRRQPAYDLTFSLPKSVSVLWALAAPEKRIEIELAILAAVRVVLAKIEKELCYTRRGHGGKQVERVQVAFAVFLHFLSRAKEPQLHVHAELFNLGLRRDGTTGAILTKPIFEQKMALGKLFRRTLAERLERDIGLPLERTKDGFRIQGVPDKLCQAFSSRRKQIVAALNDRGLSGAVAAKVACLDTRAKKQEVNIDALFERWAEIARSFGFDREKADRLLGARDREKEKTQAAASTAPAGTEATLVSSRTVSSPDEWTQSSLKPSIIPARKISAEREVELERGQVAKAMRQREEAEVLPPVPQPKSSEQLLRRETASEISLHSKPLEQGVGSTMPLIVEKTAATERRDSAQGLQPTKGEKRDTNAPQKLGQKTPLRKFLDVLSLFKPLTLGPWTQSEGARRSWHIFTDRVRSTLPRARVAAAPDRGTRLFRLPLTRFEVRIVKDALFPKAPRWSPVRNWRLPKLVVGREGERLDIKGRRFSAPLWWKTFGLWRISLHRLRLFPFAPRWSPLSRLDTTVLAIHLKAKAKAHTSLSLRPAHQTLSKIRRELSTRAVHPPEPKRPKELIR